jgi:hypothetical protein
MRNRTLSIILLAAFVGTAFAAMIPTASAQQNGSVTVQLNPPTESVKPLQAPISFTGRVIFTADYGVAAGLIGIPVTYTVTKQPAWATVLVSPATAVFPAPAPGTDAAYSAERPITITVTATDQAPAFQADTIEITAVTQAGSSAGKSFTGKGNVPITAAYFSILDVQLAEAIKVERPQTPVIFPVKIQNFGNANTKVSFEIGEGTSPALQVPVPNPVTLQSKQAGGNAISADVPLTIQTPYKNGYMNEVGIVNYKITSAYALDTKLKGDESTVSVLVTTRGFYVPGPSPLLFVGLIGVIALALRRFR